jgi:periplasmic divalent cation tolerance protein
MRQVVLVTCTSRDEAVKIADTLVRERLAACVNIIPGLTSIFSWKGKIERAKETLMVIKTRRAVFEKLRRRIKSLHSYTVPEIIALEIRAGDRAYLKWLDEETRS